MIDFKGMTTSMKFLIVAIFTVIVGGIFGQLGMYFLAFIFISIALALGLISGQEQ